MSNEKSPGEILQEQLAFSPKNVGLILDDDAIRGAWDFCEPYKAFISRAKTEREVAVLALEQAAAAGFVEFAPDRHFQPGDKVFVNNRGKSIILAIIGREPLENGLRMAAAHIDSPRLDLKPNPLYEESELALLKTHYYGGIKKYQWVSNALSLHGVVVRRDGVTVPVCIGEDPGDPCFTVTDLLPHLSMEMAKRTAADAIRGEELNLLVGSLPFRDEKVPERVKLNILRILHEKYGMAEGDFLTAELTAVPATPARDVGFDRSLIGGYGQDDRVCAYTALRATLDCNITPEKTIVTVLADKEEIGSTGNTGMESMFYMDFVADLCAAMAANPRTVLARSSCLSADVTAGFDPTYPEPVEKRNTAQIGGGVALMKYTGAHGKADTSDASAEFMGEVCRIMDHNGVIWQTGELGKVDAGGGGTVAKYVAHHNVDVVDIGVPVLSMHSPFEVTSKLDVFMTYRAVSAFFEAKA